MISQRSKKCMGYLAAFVVFTFAMNVYLGGPTFHLLDHVRFVSNFAQPYNKENKDTASETDVRGFPSDQACIPPDLPVDDPEMPWDLKFLSPTKCQAQQDWVYVDNGTLRFSPEVRKKKSYTCNFYPLVRDNDDDTHFAKPVVNFQDGFKLPVNFGKVLCKAKHSNETYENLHKGIAYDKALAGRKGGPLKSGFGGLSIAVLSYDSMSRVSWLRRLVKTRAYFHRELGAIELKNFNILGDGTIAQMLPMLTGKTEGELPECRKKQKNAMHMNTFPFIWHDMKKAGYLTSWSNSHSTPFNWKFIGFKEQPTDFYSLPFYLEASREYYNKNKNMCLGSQTRSKIWLNWFLDIFRMYPRQRKFLYHHLVDWSHDDNNLITMIDDDIKETVKYLLDHGYLNNTVLLLASDHGARFPRKLSFTVKGNLEERLPYVSLLFPPWFAKKYPEAMKNLRANAVRLTTPFDMHETFKDFLNFRGTGRGDLSHRGISLFQQIPKERTCKDAGISTHWCACLSWKRGDANDTHAKKALDTAVSKINELTAKFRADCMQLSLAKVVNVYYLQVWGNGAGTSQDTPERIKYRIVFYTAPGNGLYEATITREIKKNSYSLNTREISRLNKYGNDPKCILSKNPYIKQYCYCKNNLIG